MTTTDPDITAARADLGQWARNGLIGGVVAGITFVLFEMIAAALLAGLPAFFMPLRAISGIILGMQALDPSFSLVTAAIVGMLTHMALSMIYGVAFGMAVAMMPALRSSSTILIAAATAVGLVLWLVNFYLIAPAAVWAWFGNANPVVQFLAHTFFYGSVLGIYLDRVVANPMRRAR